MVRVVLDTNVLVNADRGEFSHPKRILDLVRWGELEAVISDPVRREKQLILDRLVQDAVLKKSVKEYFIQAKKVEPVAVDVTIDDAEDVKLLELAVGGGAQFLITDDRHLLEIGEYHGVNILTPQAFWQWWEARQDNEGKGWQSWAKSVLGK